MVQNVPGMLEVEAPAKSTKIDAAVKENSRSFGKKRFKSVVSTGMTMSRITKSFSRGPDDPPAPPTNPLAGLVGVASPPAKAPRKPHDDYFNCLEIDSRKQKALDNDRRSVDMTDTLSRLLRQQDAMAEVMHTQFKSIEKSLALLHRSVNSGNSSIKGKIKIAAEAAKKIKIQNNLQEDTTPAASFLGMGTQHASFCSTQSVSDPFTNLVKRAQEANRKEKNDPEDDAPQVSPAPSPSRLKNIIDLSITKKRQDPSPTPSSGITAVDLGGFQPVASSGDLLAGLGDMSPQTNPSPREVGRSVKKQFRKVVAQMRESKASCGEEESVADSDMDVASLTSKMSSRAILKPGTTSNLHTPNTCSIDTDRLGNSGRDRGDKANVPRSESTLSVQNPKRQRFAASPSSDLSLEPLQSIKIAPSTPSSDGDKESNKTLSESEPSGVMEEEEEEEEEECLDEEYLDEVEQQRVFDFRVKQAERSLAANKQYVMGESVILPDSRLRQVFDFCYLLVVFVEAITVMYKILYYDAVPNLHQVVISLGGFAFHVVFIKVVSHTAVLKGYALEDRSLSDIRRAYTGSWLYFDIFSSLPYELCFLNFTFGRFMGLPKLLHAWRVLSLFASANPLKPPSGWCTVAKAIFWCMWTINIIGSLYLVIDDQGGTPGDTRTDQSDMLEQYLKGLYWATVTLSSVGYGDIVPENKYSRLYSLPIILLSVIVLSFLTGQVASSVIRLDAFQQNVNEKKSKLYSLMRHYEVPWEVQKGAFNIYPALLETSLKDYFEILRDLPPFMQEKVILCVKRKIVSRVPLFQGIEERTLTALAAVTQQVLVAPYEFIIVEGDLGHEMYFIAQGVVEVILTSPSGEEISAATLQSGSWFGEIALLKQTQRTASVRSVTACSCFKLQKQDFRGILSIFPAFEDKIRRVVEERIGENDDKVNGGVECEGGTPLSDNICVDELDDSTQKDCPFDNGDARTHRSESFTTHGAKSQRVPKSPALSTKGAHSFTEDSMNMSDTIDDELTAVTYTNQGVVCFRHFFPPPLYT